MESSTVFPSLPNSATNRIVPTDKSLPGNDGNRFEGIFVTLFGFVMLAGFIGNAMVILTICRKSSLRTPCNILIMNIAIVDLLVAIGLTPLRIAEIFIGWPLGNFVCQFVGPLQDVIMCVSVVTHSIIALERYRVIVTPFKNKLTLGKAKIAIAISYCACYALTGVPLALVLKEQEKGGVYFCRATWPSISSRRVFEVYLVASFIFLPLVIQTGVYIIIVSRLKREDASIELARSGTVVQRRNQVRKKARLVKMLIILVVVFQICLIPRGAYILVKEFVSVKFKMQNEDLLKVFSIATIIMYYLKHVFNPFILFAMSAEFRKNCFGCRTMCYNKLDVAVSSMLQHVSRQSDSGDAKETKSLYDETPEAVRKDAIEASETTL